MNRRQRVYDAILADHLRRHRQMAFVTGPRQVGKTTTCRHLATAYLNWDNPDDREVVLAGPAATAARIGLDRLSAKPSTALFDELHKFARWKTFLKGFYDTYADSSRILVTGSSRMDFYRRGGHSLLGRYFPYRMHPFSVAEALHQDLPPARILRRPAPISETDFQALWKHGGYPEPFLKRDSRFTRRWTNLRGQQLLREDIRDLTRIHELGQIQALAELLAARSGEQIIYSTLARAVQVSSETLRHWIDTLAGLHLGFLLRPWFKSVSRSLRKEPKWFLRDWSGVDDEGKRAETFLACHLLKAVEGWTDLGLGQFHLGYLRDVAKNEVDFLVVRDGKPWLLVEAKKSDDQLSPALGHFQRQLGAPHAFQVVLDADYVDADCFAQTSRSHRPLVVPARTFLSQLL
ncbi:MAG: AAA family ATPase [Planctomycetota bacterium]|nr:AAA family ATPase [Planctomycetota bacterium]